MGIISRSMKIIILKISTCLQQVAAVVCCVCAFLSQIAWLLARTGRVGGVSGILSALRCNGEDR